ncbi:hypothetical protein Bca52824_011501 [Brassica carinata]|uniref:Uncharacterized protein n=1 Tax=Brassica carinata TaxID=52824 RepID=A0A8X7WDC6_BRACI|nr:hypothetical protein Bca52824_011501 [Brassica carinata]
MKTVVSVEISVVNRNILKDFWEQTNQRFSGFDLVIGGSMCNNLAGANRVSRSGLEGEQSLIVLRNHLSGRPIGRSCRSTSGQAVEPEIEAEACSG